MLEEAARRWPADIRPPTLLQSDGLRTPLQPGSVGLVIISVALHHVNQTERPNVYGELHRLLRHDGRLVVFEHNPLNPMTRYVVAHTPIDRNAVLLRAGEVCSALRQGRFTDVRTNYLTFLAAASFSTGTA
jgi:SAM-dependent methyltransferase